MSIAAFNFFFVSPRFILAVHGTRYVVTFAVMFFVAFAISRLTSQIRQQADEARLRERQTAALYEMSKELLSERDPRRLQLIAAQHIGQALDATDRFLLTDRQGALEFGTSGAGEGMEEEAARWAFANRQPAGAVILNGPDADSISVPLILSFPVRHGSPAVLLVNGFNGLGLHTLFGVIRLFGGTFRNFVFLHVGVVDAGTFTGADEVGRLKAQVKRDLDRCVRYMRCHGYYAAGYSSLGTEVVDEVERIMPEIRDRFSNAVLFGGQLAFPRTTVLSNIFHNYTIFAVQRRFYSQGIPLVVLPIRV